MSEDYWKARLAESLAKRAAAAARFDAEILEARRHLKRIAKGEARREREWKKWTDRHGTMTPEERADRWLRRFTNIGPTTSKRILTEVGGADGLWKLKSKIRQGPLGGPFLDRGEVRVPWRVLEALQEAMTPPWDDPRTT